MTPKMTPGLVTFACLLQATIALAEWRPVELEFPKVEDAKTLNITALGIAGAGNFYLATSDSRLYRWDGKAVEEIKHDESGNPEWVIRNIVVNADDDIWAFGDNGFSLRFDGESWQAVRNPLTGIGQRKGSIWAAACADRDQCFAGSQEGRLIRWDGTRWDDVLSPAKDERIYGIQLTSPDSGWMAADGFLASWNGKRWTKADLEDVPRMYDVALIGRDWGWAVGDAGTVFKYDGEEWQEIEIKGSFFRLRSIACASKTECWAAGEAGAVFRWNGTQWERVRLGTINRLTTVKVTANKALIAGDKAALFVSGER